MNGYEAKFEREAKDHPTCWVIAPNMRGGFKVVRIASDPTPKVKLRLA